MCLFFKKEKKKTSRTGKTMYLIILFYELPCLLLERFPMNFVLKSNMTKTQRSFTKTWPGNDKTQAENSYILSRVKKKKKDSSDIEVL